MSQPSRSEPGRRGGERLIVVATRNPGKLREIVAILGDLPARLVGLDAMPAMPEVREDGASFLDNAVKKARHYAACSGLWVLADDSGLEVDALGGAPGVRSARYAGPGSDDAANNAKLLAELAGVPEHERTARFRCVVVLADGEAVLARAEGTVEGVILDEPRGGEGFGYDPLFFVPSLGCTTAELSLEQKNRISHRGRALRAIKPQIRRLLAERAGGRPGSGGW